MKKSTCLFLLILSACFSTIAISQEANTVPVPILKTPYLQEMLKQIKTDAKIDFHKNKKDVMELLRRAENYTPQEYNALFSNYENNPPFIEKNGIFELNPDYIGKNKKYIEKDGVMVENKNYIEQTFPEETNPLVVKSSQITQQKNRLGNKSFKINPDLFEE